MLILVCGKFAHFTDIRVVNTKQIKQNIKRKKNKVQRSVSIRDMPNDKGDLRSKTNDETHKVPLIAQ